MTAIPSVAAAAYQAIAKIGTQSAAAGNVVGSAAGTHSFADFLSSTLDNSVSAIKQGETTAMNQIAGKAGMVDVVTAINNAEMTLNTVVAVRDKVIAAYQSIMQMPI